ncbi:MAG TPA: hypothetical protein PL009_11000 [Flavipsychrobacter sp.]|nr:hypothetical protein [Flavipsychrobacter sp.]
MGIVACILFGVIGAWITRSLIAHLGVGSLKTVLIIGIIGGAMGLLGTTIGWGDFESFNLFNVLLSIFFSGIITLIYSKTQTQAKISE